jgi:CHAT domain-containing protein
MEHLQESLAIAREVDDRLGQGKAHNGIGQVYHHLGQYQRALDHYQQALGIFREFGDRALEGNCLGRIGNTDAKLARYPEALQHHQQALAIFQELGDRQAEGAAFGNLGNVDMSLARYPQALERYQQALAIHRETGDRMGEANDHSNIGTVYQGLGRYPQALEHHQLALTIDREAGYRPGEATDLANIGSVYASLTQFPQALEHARQALTIFRETGNRHQEGITLDTIGRVSLLQGQITEARPAIEGALAIFRETGARTEEAAALTTLAAAQSAQGQLPQVVTTLGEALTLALTTGDAETLRGIQDGLRRTLARQNQSSAAIFFGKLAVNTIQDLRGRPANMDQTPQPSLLGDKEQVFRGLASLLMDRGRLAEAVQVLAMLKEEELYVYQRQEATKLVGIQTAFSKTETPWRERYQRISHQLNALGQELDTLQEERRQGLDPSGEARRQQLGLDLQAGRKTVLAFLDELRATFDRKGEGRAVEFGELERKRLTDMQGILKQLAGVGDGDGVVVLVHTLMTDDRLRMVVTPAKGPLILREGGVAAAELTRKIGEFRAALAQPDQDPRPLGRELYQWLIAPLAADLRQAKAKVLMVSLDDVLRYLPLAALHDGRRYLVEDYAIVIDTAAARSGLATRPQSAWRMAGLGLSELSDQVRQAGFKALPEVDAELDGLVRWKGRRDPGGVLPGVKYLNREFTLTRLSAVLRDSFPVVHLASPCRLQPGVDTDACLLLGDGGQERLTMDAFRGVDYPLQGLDLLTLSACQTAMGGQDAKGKELEGFGAMARNQGAQAVLTTLWPVADASRALIMERFYRLHQDRHLSKAEALRQAQLTLLGNPETATGPPSPTLDRSRQTQPAAANRESIPPQDQTRPLAHPYYWAPFILFGNWL